MDQKRKCVVDQVKGLVEKQAFDVADMTDEMLEQVVTDIKLLLDSGIGETRVQEEISSTWGVSFDDAATLVGAYVAEHPEEQEVSAGLTIKEKLTVIAELIKRGLDIDVMSCVDDVAGKLSDYRYEEVLTDFIAALETPPDAARLSRLTITADRGTLIETLLLLEEQIYASGRYYLPRDWEVLSKRFLTPDVSWEDLSEELLSSAVEMARNLLIQYRIEPVASIASKNGSDVTELSSEEIERYIFEKLHDNPTSDIEAMGRDVAAQFGVSEQEGVQLVDYVISINPRLYQGPVSKGLLKDFPMSRFWGSRKVEHGESKKKGEEGKWAPDVPEEDEDIVMERKLDAMNYMYEQLKANPSLDRDQLIKEVAIEFKLDTVEVEQLIVEVAGALHSTEGMGEVVFANKHAKGVPALLQNVIGESTWHTFQEIWAQCGEKDTCFIDRTINDGYEDLAIARALWVFGKPKTKYQIETIRVQKERGLASKKESNDPVDRMLQRLNWDKPEEKDIANKLYNTYNTECKGDALCLVEHADILGIEQYYVIEFLDYMGHYIEPMRNEGKQAEGENKSILKSDNDGSTVEVDETGKAVKRDQSGNVIEEKQYTSQDEGVIDQSGQGYKPLASKKIVEDVVVVYRIGDRFIVKKPFKDEFNAVAYAAVLGEAGKDSEGVKLASVWVEVNGVNVSGEMIKNSGTWE